MAISRYNTDADEFFPRSALMEDIRNLVKNASQVIAIIQKPIPDKGTYKAIKYVARGIEIKNISIPEEISETIEL